MNLCFSEDAVLNFDAIMKVLPVLRTAKDQKALWEGIIDGTIDEIGKSSVFTKKPLF